MKERTLIIVKPDGMKRKLVGEIISRYEKAGLKIVSMKMMEVKRNFAEKHYPKSKQQILGMGHKTLNAAGEEEAKRIFGTIDPWKIGLILREWMVKFLISYPVIAFILEGEDAVQLVRKVTGFTDPSRAEKGTIRGDLGIDSIINANREKRATENLVHASGSVEEAEKEIKLWFKKNEIY